MGRDAWVAALAIAAVAAAAVAPSPLRAADGAPQAVAGSKDVKSCSVCHKPEEGKLRAFFDGVSMKSRSIQLKLDDRFEVVRFDRSDLKVVDVDVPGDLESALRRIRKGHEVRVTYADGADGVKVVSELSVKPPMKVDAAKLVDTKALERLLAGKERFTLIDARPPLKYQEGTIPGAVNVPFPAFQKNLDRLPRDKGELVVYFCAGVT